MSYEEIDLGNMLLMNFVNRFQQLYGDINMVYNVHLLTHLGKIVSLWGPLWAYSAFTFETSNGTLLNLVKGTRGVTTQIVEKYLSYKSVERLLKVHNVSSSVLNLCSLFMAFPLNKTVLYNSSRDIVLLGNPVKKHLSFNEQAAFRNKGYDPKDCEYYFKRLIYKGDRYTCSLYTRQQKTCDCTVLLNNGDLFLFNVKCIMLVKKIPVTDKNICKDFITGVAVDYIRVCGLNTVYLLNLMHVNNVKKKLISMNVGKDLYISTFPNTFEKD